MKVFELVIDDENEDLVYAVSLVNEPAIQSDFIFFNKVEQKFATIDKDQRLVVGPVLIPDKKILRYNEQTDEPYYVYFSKDTIKKFAYNFVKNKYTDKATIEHEKVADGVFMVESWIKEGKMDKSSRYGLKVPEGTWLATYYIEDDEIWNDYIKTGKLKGFSVEMIAEHKFVGEDDDFYDTQLMQIMNEETDFLLSQIRALIKKDNRTKSGERIEMESYKDYPQSVRNNAKRGRELNEKQNNKCATQTGKIRASQLEKGQPISLSTIKRMYSYLSRAEEYYDPNTTTECGTISFLLWGGLAGKRWAESKLKELGEIEENQQPSITSTYPGEASGSMVSEETLQKAGEINVFGYETEYFYICPGAIGTFNHLKEMNPDEETQGMIRSAALQADKVFEIEARVKQLEATTPKQLDTVKILVEDFYDLMREIDEELGMEHDVSYMDGHIQVIESYLRDE